MTADRYLKIILTVIAIELFWIGIRDTAPAVAAQAAPTPVIIRGIELNTGDAGVLPVAILDTRAPVPVEAAGAIRIEAERPLRIEVDRPVPVETPRPIQVEAERPLPVQSVPYTPAARPGE